jgi:rhomboid protease GluP
MPAARSILCPSCGRIVGSEEASCSWCGAKRPGAVAKWTDLSRIDPSGDGLIKGIMAANILFYAVSLIVSRHRGFGMNPLSFLAPDQRSLLLLGATGEIPVFELGRFWTLVAASYLHGGLLHIFFNMLALRQIGPWVCAEFGPSRMFIIYTFSGVAGYLVSCFAGVPFTIGASASVCGLIGALFYFGKSRGGNYGSAVSREVTGWLVSLVLFGLVMPGINNWGHGGGVVGGVALAWLLGYRERGPERTPHRLLALLAIIVTIGILVWAGYETFALFGTSMGPAMHGMSGITGIYGMGGMHP